MFGTAAQADEGEVKRLLEGKTGGRVHSVVKTPYSGLYEVQFNSELVYTDEKVTHVFVGNVFDPDTRQNLTQERLNKLSVIKFADLPLDQAVKTVRGNGRRVIATFEDPNCGHCKRLAQDIDGIKDVTVYTFLYPVLSPDSKDKAQAVWCAADRARTWHDLMVGGSAPKAEAGCETPIEKNLLLGERLRVKGTPTIFLSNGERIPGAVPVAQLEEKIDRAASIGN
jgi:thiol:disulfide interchange protein DsbC